MPRARLTANLRRATALVASLLAAGCCSPAETTGVFSYETSPTTATLRGVVSLDGLTALAVGDDGTILLRDGSPEAGTWTIEDAGVTADLFAITAPDRAAGPVLAVGAGGTIVRGISTGGSWLHKVSGVEADLRAITFFADSRKQVVAVGDGVVLLSTDQGDTWTAPSVPDDTGVLRAVRTRQVADGAAMRWELLAVGDAGRGIFSKDSGASWTAFALATDATLLAIDVGFLIYDDEGTTWQPDADASLEYVVRKHEAAAVLSIARNEMWLTTAEGVVQSLAFGDRGPADEQRGPLLAVDGDSHNGIAVGADGSIVRAALTTSDGCQ